MKEFITKSVVLCLLVFLSSCEGMDGLVKETTTSPEIIYTGDFSLDGPEATFEEFNYTHISGNLAIAGTLIQQLNALEILLSVEGDIIVENNSTLNNLNGIDGLEYVGGDIRFTNNPQLNQVNLRNACQRIIDEGGTILGQIFFDGVEIVL